MNYQDARETLRKVADEDIGDFGRAFRHGDEWLLVLEDEDPVKVTGYCQGTELLDCQAD
jgi:hypothetical protein